MPMFEKCFRLVSEMFEKCFRLVSEMFEKCFENTISDMLQPWWLNNYFRLVSEMFESVFCRVFRIVCGVYIAMLPFNF